MDALRCRVSEVALLFKFSDCEIIMRPRIGRRLGFAASRIGSADDSIAAAPNVTATRKPLFNGAFVGDLGSTFCELQGELGAGPTCRPPSGGGSQ
jgi:hypothetical protein